MTSSSSLSLHVQSIIAEALTNISASNPNTPSHHVRKEAWTEIFGNQLHSTSGNRNDTHGHSSAIQGQVSPLMSRTVNSSSRIREVVNPSDIELFQYRMEWEVQLILRLYCVPHTVVNSPYLSNQCTGVLPQFRSAPSQTIIGNRDILPYLVQELNLHADLTLEHESNVTAVCALLKEQNRFLHMLRYGDGDAWEQVHRYRSIDACTRHVPIRCNKVVDDSRKDTADDFRPSNAASFHSWWTFGNGFARLQAWAERSVFLNQIQMDASTLIQNSALNVEKIKELVRKGYQALDSKLRQGGGTLLGTNTFTIADIQLFGHLAEALCDVHLVTILADYHHLIAFYQVIYMTYFGRGYYEKSVSNHPQGLASDGKNELKREKFQWIKDQDWANASKFLVEFYQKIVATYFGGRRNKNQMGLTADDDKGESRLEKFQWIKENDWVNASNQFNCVPIKDDCGSFGWRSKWKARHDKGDGEFMDAFQIMQEVAFHCRDLKEILADMKLQREKEDKMVAKDSVGHAAGSLFHKWRMGADLKMKSSPKKKRDDPSYDDSEDEDDENVDDFTRKSRQQMKKMMKQAKKNDELWISAVLCVTAIGLLASSSVSAA